MKKKRVKIFIDGDVLVLEHFSGIGHYTADLLRAMDSLLFENDYAHFDIEIGIPRSGLHKLARFNFQNFGVRKFPMPQRFINGLKQENKLPPIDLLFGKKVYIFPNYSSWPTLFSPSMPIIYDLSFVHHSHFVEPRNQAFLIEQVKHSVKRSNKIITISSHSKNEIIKEYKKPEKEIIIAYPAVDLHKFYKRSEHEIAYKKGKYGVFGNYMLFVGNIEPRKNLISLLKAYNQLPKDVQHAYSLLLIGAKGWLDSEISEMIISMRTAGLKVIQPTNYVNDDDLPALYSGASLFVYVSRYEGFGIPPLESMACGTPVISSNNSSLPEAVGNAAVSISALDVPGISNAIVNTLNDKQVQSDLIKKGYDHINKFSWIESARKVLKAAEELSS